MQKILFAKSHYAGFPILSALGSKAHDLAELFPQLSDVHPVDRELDWSEDPDGIYLWEGEIQNEGTDEDWHPKLEGAIRLSTFADLSMFGLVGADISFRETFDMARKSDEGEV